MIKQINGRRMTVEAPVADELREKLRHETDQDRPELSVHEDHGKKTAVFSLTQKQNAILKKAHSLGWYSVFMDAVEFKNKIIARNNVAILIRNGYLHTTSKVKVERSVMVVSKYVLTEKGAAAIATKGGNYASN